MKPPQSLISLVLVILCGGILVLFTDVELLLVRWVSCGPIAKEVQKIVRSAADQPRDFDRSGQVPKRIET